VIAQIKKCLTNNVGIKISALLIAALVWLAVVNISDPEKTVTIYGIPITITHEDAIDDLNIVYDADDVDTVNITISGKRSIVSNLTASDFIATASLEELSKVNSIPVEVSSIRTIASRNITIVKQSVRTVKLNVESLEQHKYPIEVEFSGEPSSGYTLGDYKISKSSVQVTAPASVHDRIEKVVAICSVDNVVHSISQKCTLELRDKHNKIIKNRHITFSKKKVTVTADVLKEKEVQVNVNPIGDVAEGYQVTNILLSSETVKIYGEENNIRDINDIEINDNIDISGKSSDATFQIDLTKYLPVGVNIDGDVNLNVTVKIARLDKKKFDIPTSNIAVDNLGSGLTAEFVDDTIEVTLSGKNDVIGQITERDVKATLDLKDYNEKGTFKAVVTIKVPEGVSVDKKVNAKIIIK
jgi:YbbR domain-containing protein